MEVTLGGGVGGGDLFTGADAQNLFRNLQQQEQQDGPGDKKKKKEPVRNQPTDQEKYNKKKKELDEQYPNKKDKVERHHKKPRYHGGTPNDETVPIPGSYHQGTTNEFKKQWGYKPNPRPSDQESEEVQKKVYDQYPLPPFDENGQSTHKIAETVTTGAAAVTTGYVIYKLVVAGLTWECFGCGVLVTP